MVVRTIVEHQVEVIEKNKKCSRCGIDINLVAKKENTYEDKEFVFEFYENSERVGITDSISFDEWKKAVKCSTFYEY